MENQQVQIYIKAAANFYGILHIQDFIHVIKHYEQVEWTRKEAMELVEKAIQTEKHIITIGKFICQTMKFPDVQAALSFYKRNQTKPFCYPQQELFFRYADESFVEVTPAHRNLALFLKQRLGASEQDITKVMRRVVEKTRGDCDMQTIMNEFLELGALKDIEEVKEFAGLLMPVMNETRRYANHGFTPDELAVLLRQA